MQDFPSEMNIEINLPEVQSALVNQRIYHKVHDWHQNQDQDRVDSLVGGKKQVSLLL